MKWDTRYLINFMISDTWLVLNLFGLIVDGVYTLDNRRPVLPFDYVDRGLTGDDYVEGDYDENSYVFRGVIGFFILELRFSLTHWFFDTLSYSCKISERYILSVVLI